MKFKSIVSILFFSLSLFMHAYAQRGNMAKKKERVESLKVAFLTQKLDLSPEEAALFWPIYNEMNEELTALKRERRLSNYRIQDFDENRAAELIELNLESEQKQLDLKKEYIGKLIQAISAKKVILLNNSEEQFKKELLREMRTRNN